MRDQVNVPFFLWEKGELRVVCEILIFCGFLAFFPLIFKSLH